MIPCGVWPGLGVRVPSVGFRGGRGGGSVGRQPIHNVWKVLVLQWFLSHWIQRTQQIQRIQHPADQTPERNSKGYGLSKRIAHR